MVSKGFFRGSQELIERSDGRHQFFHYRGERCLSALVTAGRGIARLQSASAESKIEYLDVLSELNDHYFEARAFENNVKGKFYRYDDETERRFRSSVTEELSRSVGLLRRLLAVHGELLEPNADTGQFELVNSAETVNRELVATVSKYTGRAVRGGWYPIIQSYDHSLNPGERIAEGNRRRRQRLFGQQDIPGVTQLLDTPLFEQITNDDIARLRKLDRFAPTEGRRIVTRLNNRQPWLLSD
ncbi:hypothetical protein SAMN05421858_1268 [Haladaptatus litoreus]|uniref:Uncharacterized protein n=1 Tax=Haladaptatus litoreus TaxID=553468 RepID=A0A1N6XTF3_9EURY|nr:hypothetical protein [Haladaptatus litoreus]SIR05632.1 hypothetical protein SAMN05421858_1268 [Haladaptatus litoreus]